MQPSSVSFYLGHSTKPIRYTATSSCSSTDIESDADWDRFVDCYSYADADGYAKMDQVAPIDIKHPVSPALGMGLVRCRATALVTPPSDPLRGSSTMVSAKAIKSIAQLSKAYSLPPSPPVSPVLEKPKFPLNPSTLLETHNSKQSMTMTPQPAPSNDLIDINLDPVSPFYLTSDGYADDEDVDDFYLDDEDYYDQDSDEDEDYQSPVSPEYLVGHELEIISHLNLEDHPVVVDKFRPRPLLADPERPFIPSSPVYESVHDLLMSCYPFLTRGSTEYNRHMGRLQRNRDKLRSLSESIECYDQKRRERRVSEIEVGRSASFDENRFRARR